jgi:excisionase family DNA binding protein
MNGGIVYGDRVLHSINEARHLLGGISLGTLYKLLRSGELASVVVGCRRFISAEAIAEFVKGATTTVSPAVADVRTRRSNQSALPLRLPPAIIKTRARAREV